MKIKNNRGELGVSTLIIFLAVVIVAAVAAVVLIGASSSLQQRALDTSSQAKRTVGSTIYFMNIVGSDGDDGDLEDFEVLMKLQVGSDSLALNYTLISASTSSWAQEMEYNGSGTSAFGTDSFWVEWVKNGPEYQEDFISNGDIVKLRFHAGTPLGEAKKLSIKIAPRVGVVSVVEFSTPTVIREAKVNLYPMAI